MTAPTNEWSKTQRVATFATVTLCRSPILRRTCNNDWKSSHVPHLTIISKYCEIPLEMATSQTICHHLTIRWETVSLSSDRSGSGDPIHLSAKYPPHYWSRWAIWSSIRRVSLTRVPYVTSFILCFLHKSDIPWSGRRSTRENCEEKKKISEDMVAKWGTYLNLVSGNCARSQFRAYLICSNTIEVTQSDRRDEAFLLKFSKNVETEHVILARIVLPMKLQPSLRHGRQKDQWAEHTWKWSTRLVFICSIRSRTARVTSRRVSLSPFSKTHHLVAPTIESGWEYFCKNSPCHFDTSTRYSQ